MFFSLISSADFLSISFYSILLYFKLVQFGSIRFYLIWFTILFRIVFHINWWLHLILIAKIILDLIILYLIWFDFIWTAFLLVNFFVCLSVSLNNLFHIFQLYMHIIYFKFHCCHGRSMISHLIWFLSYLAPPILFPSCFLLLVTSLYHYRHDFLYLLLIFIIL